MLLLVWEQQNSALATVQTQHSWVVANFEFSACIWTSCISS